MASKKNVPEPSETELEDVVLSSDVSDRALEETPELVVKFIVAARRHKHIYRLLFARGYNAGVVQEAWGYLDALGGVTAIAAGSSDDGPSADEKSVAKAMSDLDDWDEPNFDVIDAALRRRFPEQHRFLFAGNLKASKGPIAVAGVRTMIRRIDALESSPERKATRAQDKAALELLAKRGIDKTERQKVAAWLAIVGDQDDTVLEGADEAHRAELQTEVERRNTLVRLREWHEEWARVARTAVKRKRDRMYLGLARQKKAKVEVEEPDGEEPVEQT